MSSGRLATGLAFVSGEITTAVYVDIQRVVRDTIKAIGYTDPVNGFDYETCAVLTSIDEQSRDIAMGVDRKGAGDQGLMFGYACNETPELMPAPIMYAHQLGRELTRIRKAGKAKWLRPDAKSQVSVRYANDQPVEITNVVISTQHAHDVEHKTIKEFCIEEAIKKTLPKHLLTKNTTFLINPTGRFVVGGPQGDTGLTGRKIIVDTYGGMARHGGGAFSGKDPSKVDRSAAYAMRWVAKNVVAAGLAKRCETQVAYAIGKAAPVGVFVETFGTGVVPDAKIQEAVLEVFDLRPAAIIRDLDLLRPIYAQTAAYGHFGRELPEFTWERTDKAAIIREKAGL